MPAWILNIVEMHQFYSKLYLLRCSLVFRISFLFCSFIFIHINNLQSQIYYTLGFNSNKIYRIDINSECNCIATPILDSEDYTDDASISPSGNLFAPADSTISPFHSIYKLNFTTGDFEFAYLLPPNTLTDIGGLVALNDSLFYFHSRLPGNPFTSMYRFDARTNIITDLGPFLFTYSGGMTMFEGNVYVSVIGGYVLMDTINTGNSTLAVSTLPFPGTYGVCGSHMCNTLLGTSLFENTLWAINLIDGSVRTMCEIPEPMWWITSLVEFEPEPLCAGTLDLDCNDSSGAVGADYNSPDFDCLSGGVPIADEDAIILMDTFIEELTINLSQPLPDAPEEILMLGGPAPEIIVTGDGTTSMIFSNGGNARAQDFIMALRNVLYMNNDFFIAAGLRTVEVQYTTVSGAMSNIARAYIQVNELPLIDVDLGPDQIICEGETYTFDAGNHAGSQTWSTGETSQTITTGVPGTYIVTVTNSFQCPNRDTVELETIPLINLSLIGDSIVCDNESVQLTIVSDGTFPVEVEISATPGQNFSFDNVMGQLHFTDDPISNTVYEIISVIPSQPACIEITDPEQSVEFFPSFIHEAEVMLCDGDSILLGTNWESEAGEYENVFNSIEGCDSVVFTTVIILPAVQISIQNQTCDSLEVGTSYQYLPNPNGCDTVIQTTTILLESDTTYLFLSTCKPTEVGVFQDVFSNQLGCDSVVIRTVVQDIPGDTTYYSSTSCDSSTLGIFENHFNNILGCDSTVFTEVTYSPNDSVFIQSASCDPADVGIFIQHLVNRFGCDSIVTSAVTLSPSNDTFISSTTCNPSEAGVFVETLINQYGCDSIVTEQIELLQSDETFLFSTTCMSSQAGMFITTHFNQFGCDSIVTLTITLIPADTTFLSVGTCDSVQVGYAENTFTNMDGCDSLVIEQTTLFSLPDLQLTVTSDFNGYGISCFGENDGSANVTPTGIPPWTFFWATGSDDQMITGLNAGSYAVTVTDGNGCTASGNVMLLEPAEFSISFVVSQPDCFDHQEGSITVEQIGGVEPVRYSVDGINYQSSPVFDQLAGGTYTFTAIDANDCETKEIIWINVPLMVNVELPDDQIVLPGDTVIINAIVNVPFDSLASITWSGLNNPGCPNCLSQPIAPIITTTYSVTVTTFDGCTDDDAMTLFLENNSGLFVPNVFTPNGDQINDILMIHSGPDIKILEFTIFDRWGNMVYNAQNFSANDPAYGWDGKLKEKDFNSGVFAYKIIVEFDDGKQDVRYGDITLLK